MGCFLCGGIFESPTYISTHAEESFDINNFTTTITNNEESFLQDFRENLEEMFPLYYMHIHVCSSFKYPTNLFVSKWLSINFSFTALCYKQPTEEVLLQYKSFKHEDEVYSEFTLIHFVDYRFFHLAHMLQTRRNVLTLSHGLHASM